MNLNPQEIYRRYKDHGTAGYLLGAMEFALENLSNVSPLDIMKKDATGDIVTQMDRTVHDSVITYFQENGIPVRILGEEGQSSQEEPEYVLLIDEIEGTQNAVNDLDYGINMAIARYRLQLKVSDLESAVVCNIRDDTIYVGERGKGAYKIIKGEKKELTKKKTDVYELPSPKAYTTEPEQERRQEILAQIFQKRLGNQPRSVDATGTRLVELADSNIRAYGDQRGATKCWDVLPSALILREAGYVITDILGFGFSEAIFYDENNPNYEGDGGLNRRIGEDFIAASKEDHKLLVYGDQSDSEGINCVWDCILGGPSAILPSVGIYPYAGGSAPIQVRRQMIQQQKIDRLIEFGRERAGIVDCCINGRRVAYGALDPNEVRDTINYVRQRFVDVFSDEILKEYFDDVPEEKLQRGHNLHLIAFDEAINEAMRVK